MIWLFWICVALIAYPYVIYPLLLVGINRFAGAARARRRRRALDPRVTIILPVHNEARRIERQVRNLLALDYPRGEACRCSSSATPAPTTRSSAPAAGQRPRRCDSTWRVRAGKAAAPQRRSRARDRRDRRVHRRRHHSRAAGAAATRRRISPIRAIGCVSGEDYIEGADTEGLYGRLELLLRREEARLHSIAGASGCFYGQRRTICLPFDRGMAPDFLVGAGTPSRAGQRALAEPAARGSMTATSSQRAEFTRKVRTFLRGITALFGNARLLNPFVYPAFSFILVVAQAHALAGADADGRAVCVAAWLLRAEPLYFAVFIAQVLAYAVGDCSGSRGRARGAREPGASRRVLPAGERRRVQGAAAVAGRAPGSRCGNRRGDPNDARPHRFVSCTCATRPGSMVPAEPFSTRRRISIRLASSTTSAHSSRRAVKTSIRW